MASGMTKTQLVRHLAEKLESNNKTAAAFLEHLTDVAVKETKKNGVFVVPGLGRLKSRPVVFPPFFQSTTQQRVPHSCVRTGMGDRCCSYKLASVISGPRR